MYTYTYSVIDTIYSYLLLHIAIYLMHCAHFIITTGINTSIQLNILMISQFIITQYCVYPVIVLVKNTIAICWLLLNFSIAFAKPLNGAEAS